MKTYRIRIYSTLNGNEDFAGPDIESLILRARAKVAAYLEAGTHAKYIGAIC